MNSQSINRWLEYHGLKWVEGQERMYKSQLSWLEARDIVEQLKQEGAVEDDA